ncbi:hypothetical protein C8R46DRAFT_1096375 [Mycena filopes]|nr:hypothetical protein C8R46DRAFT_1096375 [Mycena filopes]
MPLIIKVSLTAVPPNGREVDGSSLLVLLPSSHLVGLLPSASMSMSMSMSSTRSPSPFAAPDMSIGAGTQLSRFLGAIPNKPTTPQTRELHGQSQDVGLVFRERCRGCKSRYWWRTKRTVSRIGKVLDGGMEITIPACKWGVRHGVGAFPIEGVVGVQVASPMGPTRLLNPRIRRHTEDVLRPLSPHPPRADWNPIKLQLVLERTRKDVFAGEGRSCGNAQITLLVELSRD